MMKNVVTMQWHLTSEELPEENREVMGIYDVDGFEDIAPYLYYLKKGTLLNVERDISNDLPKSPVANLMLALADLYDATYEVEEDGWYIWDDNNEERLLRFRKSATPKYWTYLTMPNGKERVCIAEPLE